MRLSDMAMAEPEEDVPDDVDEDAGGFEDAAAEAFELAAKGKKTEAAAALKSAIELCVADYMAEE